MRVPEISIITPSYNSAEYLEETIQSVLHQTFQDWEWLITDDKSQDLSVEIIEKYVEKAKNNDNDELRYEIADLYYHTLVLMIEKKDRLDSLPLSRLFILYSSSL